MSEKIIPIPDSGAFAAFFCECGQILGFICPGYASTFKCSACGRTYVYEIDKRTITVTKK